MTGTEQVRDELGGRLSAALGGGLQLEHDSSGDLRISVPLSKLVETCALVSSAFRAPLATMIGLDDRTRTGTYRLAYVFATGEEWVSVETEVDPAHPAFPSVARSLPAAHWYEREVQDLLGLTPQGHPDPRRLVSHDDWPEGVYPLRKDFDPAVPVPRVNGPKHRFHHLHGDGIVEIPVGPIHAGIIEPGHFRFAAVGEVVLHLETRLFYTHRGIEKLAEGKPFGHVLFLAERICGACSLSHAIAYSQAIEAIAGVAIPQRASFLRSFFLEMERLYNHIGDLGNICAGVGFAVGSSQGARLKEELMRLNERLSGHRFLRGVCNAGGVKRDLDADRHGDATETIKRVESEFKDFAGLIMSTDSFVDRMTGTGMVTFEAARDLGAVGVAARASGIDRDVRRDRPYAAYDGLSVKVPVRTEGDVRARAQVRVDEALLSFALARELLSELPAGPLTARIEKLPPYHTALGVTESPRGENVHWVRTGPDGTIDRYRVRSASYCNWPVVATAVPGNMVPDFPLINKSFELCYSCLDR